MKADINEKCCSGYTAVQEIAGLCRINMKNEESKQMQVRSFGICYA